MIAWFAARLCDNHHSATRHDNLAVTTSPPFAQSLVWFRRDLRCFDHAALDAALKQSRTVYCCFIFDTAILASLPPHDRRIPFIHACIAELTQELAAQGGQLLVRHASAEAEIPRLARELNVDAVFFNHDYEPQAIARDARVTQTLAQDGIPAFSFKDQVVFEKNEILTQQGKPFSVFTPYKNAWLARLHANPAAALPLYPCEARAGQWGQWSQSPTSEQNTPPALPSLDELGFGTSESPRLPTGSSGAQQLWQDFVPRLAHYHEWRDYPARKGPSYLSVHLRFGTLSIRQLVRHALQVDAAVWLSELIWREFYMMILFQHPHVAGHAFKPAYDAIAWATGPDADALFDAWCQGQTGYPLVDAAMLQLNQSGYMHNRLRMVTASFLIKDLGIDWRWGEAYFAQQLNDFDLAANNGGWQWCASSGCDAQPYFRIFNPVTQSEKFDPEGQFIVRYLPQLKKLPPKARHAPWLCKPMELQMAGITLGKDYPQPLVMHDEARARTLARYAVVKTTNPASDTMS